jgi:multidrug efflux system membrane fusion protein
MAASPSSRSRARWFLYGAVVFLLAGSVWYFAFRAPHSRERYAQPAWAGTEWPPRIPVRTVTAKRQDLPRHLSAIGTVTPFNTVTVRSRVSGQVLRVTFEEGQRVEQGQLLAEIDPAPYKIKLAQAEGQLQQNAARLHSARADLERIRGLHDKNLVSNQELDAQQALVAQYEGVQITNQAQVDDARLQLAWTRIEAPIAGRTGMRRIDPGNLVVANDTAGLVVITQTRPISVSFTIPEVDLPSVLDPFRAGQTLSVEAWNRGETAVLATGVLKTADNQIDTTTGTLRLKAEFGNDDERLFPNQFVNVRMHLGELANAIVIPTPAIQFGSRGTYVYVVNAHSKVTVRDVVLGPADGTQQSIAKGLQVGEAVVTEGIDRLREGRAVVIVNETATAGTTTAANAP